MASRMLTSDCAASAYNLEVVEEALLGLWPHFDFLAKKVHIVTPQPFDEDGFVIILEYFDLWNEPEPTLRPILHECLQPELDTLDRVAWYCQSWVSRDTFPLERSNCRTEETDYTLHGWIRGQPFPLSRTFEVTAGDLVNIRFVHRNNFIESWVQRIFPGADVFKRTLIEQTALEDIDRVTWTFIGATTPGTPAVIDKFQPATSWFRPSSKLQHIATSSLLGAPCKGTKSLSSTGICNPTVPLSTRCSAPSGTRGGRSSSASCH